VSEQIGVGLIGCGNVAGLRHLPALTGLSGARVVALADPDSGKLERLADRYEVRQRYADHEALLQDPAVDVVAVLVPAARHAEILLAVLEAGKHVLVEKPLALSMADADRMVERADRSTVRVSVGFNLRAHRLVRRARELLEQGIVGPIESIDGALFGEPGTTDDQWQGWRTNQRLGGGALLEKGPHHYDLWRFLSGSEAVEVSAISRKSEAADLATVVSARLESGALATTALTEYGPALNRMTVLGPRGQLELSVLEFDGLRFTPTSAFPGDARARLRAVRDFLRELPQGLRTMRQGGEYVASYRREWQLFLDAIQDGRPVHSGLEDGRRALEISLAALSSAARGEAVRTEEVPRDPETALASPLKSVE
jgi:myo-inositol 2-dehydrogenase / D-chiro-inositol 1-dehydrogenase